MSVLTFPAVKPVDVSWRMNPSKLSERRHRGTCGTSRITADRRPGPSERFGVVSVQVRIGAPCDEPATRPTRSTGWAFKSPLELSTCSEQGNEALGVGGATCTITPRPS